MDEIQMKIEKEFKDSMTFFCEGLQNNVDMQDLLERYDHYFQMFCNHFEVVLNTWYDLRIAIRDAEVLLLMMPPFVQLVSSPYDYVRYIDCLDGIVSIFQSYAQKRMETKNNVI